ncbi:disulfide bond formation protein B [Gemmobacter fulvus]|uniref:disulfide bond formation protein B n=1 Tax=Gemmobacter fulvus TaxID=2840474 RepID=UPI002796C60D|nr:disulfide bond formation protein B [Gemmobacter fulvus]MDQ1848201.1 disulfide bond formation protein B [Gemmobacter fulvus]
MTRQRFLVLIASGGSAALLLGALGFQYLGGLAPCPLCILQRWPHLAAVLIGALALWLGGRLLPLLGALAALTTAGIGLFHAGVELKWWEGLQSCSSGSIAGLSAADLLDPSKDIAAVVRCDAIAWQMFGLSMAGWNMVISLGLTLIWLAAARRA